MTQPSDKDPRLDEIRIDKVFIDESPRGSNSIIYWLSKNMTNDPAKSTQDICFRGLFGSIVKKLSVTRKDGTSVISPNKSIVLSYRLERCNSNILTVSDIKRYIELLIINKVLPDSMDPERYSSDNILHLNVSADTCPSFLSMQLSLVRYMREEPTFVLRTLKLVDAYVLNFFIAVVVSTHMTIWNTGHNTFSSCAPYDNSRRRLEYLEWNPYLAIALASITKTRGVSKFLYETGPYESTNGSTGVHTPSFGSSMAISDMVKKIRFSEKNASLLEDIPISARETEIFSKKLSTVVEKTSSGEIEW